MTSRTAASDLAVYLQNYPSQHMFPIQPPVRLGGFSQRIARRDRHADPAVAEVTIQLVNSRGFAIASKACTRNVRRSMGTGSIPFG
jgi:hypothetical protein